MLKCQYLDHFRDMRSTIRPDATRNITATEIDDGDVTTSLVTVGGCLKTGTQNEKATPNQCRCAVPGNRSIHGAAASAGYRSAYRSHGRRSWTNERPSSELKRHVLRLAREQVHRASQKRTTGHIDATGTGFHGKSARSLLRDARWFNRCKVQGTKSVIALARLTIIAGLVVAIGLIAGILVARAESAPTTSARLSVGIYQLKITPEFIQSSPSGNQRVQVCSATR